MKRSSVLALRFVGFVLLLDVAAAQLSISGVALGGIVPLPTTPVSCENPCMPMQVCTCPSGVQCEYSCRLNGLQCSCGGPGKSCNGKCSVMDSCICSPPTTTPPTTPATTLAPTMPAITTSASTTSTSTPVISTPTTTPTTTGTTDTTRQTATSASSPASSFGLSTTDGLNALLSGPTSANLNDDTTTANSEGSAGFASGQGDGPQNLPVIITVVIAGVIVVAVVLVAVFLLRRKGVICATEPEQGPPKKSTDTEEPRNKNRYSNISLAAVPTNSQTTRSNNSAAEPLGFPGKAGSGVENSSNGAMTPAVHLTLEPDSSRVVPSAPVYFTVEADSTSGLPGNAPRDNTAASNVADKANADNVYHEINDRDVRPEDTDDEYNKLGEKKTTKTESGAIYGHLESGDVDYDHVTKGKKSDVRVRHNDYDVAPAARVDSGDYNHVTRDIRSGVTVVGSDYDVAQPRKQSVSQDEGDYDHPPHPKKVKDAKRNGAPTGSAQKEADGAGSYELAGPLSPTTPGAREASMAVTAESPGSEGQPKEPDVEANDPKPCGSPYDMASAVV